MTTGSEKARHHRFAKLEPGERRPATLEEARALAHPLRLRILRLCLDEPLTNKELASRLDMHPATVLHHVRTLVRTGFLAETDHRPGPRGTIEKPYLATGKSWRLEVGDTGGRAVRRAMLEAVAVEAEEAGPDAVLASTRMAMRLRPDQLQELLERVRALVQDFAELDEPRGEPVAMLTVIHRRPTAQHPQSS